MSSVKFRVAANILMNMEKFTCKNDSPPKFVTTFRLAGSDLRDFVNTLFRVGLLCCHHDNSMKPAAKLAKPRLHCELHFGESLKESSQVSASCVRVRTFVQITITRTTYCNKSKKERDKTTHCHPTRRTTEIFEGPQEVRKPLFCFVLVLPLAMVAVGFVRTIQVPTLCCHEVHTVLLLCVNRNNSCRSMPSQKISYAHSLLDPVRFTSLPPCHVV